MGLNLLYNCTVDTRVLVSSNSSHPYREGLKDRRFESESIISDVTTKTFSISISQDRSLNMDFFIDFSNFFLSFLRIADHFLVCPLNFVSVFVFAYATTP